MDYLTNEGTDGSKLVQMDDFLFTCLIPCTVPVTTNNGPTEFYVGSHREPAQNFDQCERTFATCPLGSALLFNGKINHRGTGNPSSEDRPVLYLVFHKRWYNDAFRVGIDDHGEI